MKKTILVLRGKSNIGKTTTIKKVYELLKEKYPQSNINEIIAKRNTLGEIEYDIKVIIIIDGIKIGIESQGDPGSRLEKSLKYFIDNKCDIILCAARTWGKTNNIIEAYSNLFKIIWIRKEIDKSNNEESNQKQAIEIIKKIENTFKDATNTQDT